VGAQKKGCPNRIIAGRVLLTISSNQQRRSTGQLNPPKHHRRRELIWKVRMLKMGKRVKLSDKDIVVRC
jgi:hypothetical protein